MKYFVQNSIEETLRQARRKKTWRRVIALFAVVTIFCTTVSLKYEAQTLERKPMCGLAEHTHEGGCMDEAGNFACGLDEHIHTDACFQESPVKLDAPVEEVNIDINDSFEETVMSEDIEPPAEEAAFELGAADEEEPVVPAEEALADAEPKEAEVPVYDFQGADHALLSAVLAQADIECAPFEVTALGESILEDGQALSVRVEPIENDYQIIPLRDFIDDDTVPFAVFTADNIWLITLKNGVTPMEVEYAEDREPAKVSDEEEKPTEVDINEFSESEAEDEIDAGEAVEDTPHQDVEEVIGDMTELSKEETAKDEAEVPAEETEDSESEEVKETSVEDGIKQTREDADEQSEEAADDDAAEQNIEETGEDAAEENEEASDDDVAEMTMEETGEDTAEEAKEETDEETTEQSENAADEDAAPRLTWTDEAFAVALNWDGELSEGAELLVQALDVDSEDYAAYRQAIGLALNPVVPEEEVVAEDIEAPAEEVEVSLGEEAETVSVEEAEPEEDEEPKESKKDSAIEDIYLFTVAVARGDEVVVPEGGEVIVTAENALFFRDAEPSGDGCFADYHGEVLAVVTLTNANAAEPEESVAEETVAALYEEETYTLEYRGEGFTVTMTYADDAEIPEGAALDVREILPGTEEYALYSDQTDAALTENWDAATALPRFFDITIFYNEEEIQPAAPVSVQIALDEAVSVSEDDEMRAIHFAEDAAQVLEAASEQPDEAAEAVSFDAESFSVYGIVPTATLTQKVITAEGETFEINVTYGKEAGIPEGARLAAEEITIESDPETYSTYTALSARALTGDADAALKLARLFDIAIVDAEGSKVEPSDTVSVEIRMANAQDGEAAFDESGELAVSVADAPVTELDDVDFDADDQPAETAEVPETEPQPVQVVHFITGDEAQVITPEASADAETGADVVSFETESFSLYSVVQLDEVKLHQETPDPLGLDGRSFAIVTDSATAGVSVAVMSNENPTNRLAGHDMQTLVGTTYSDGDANVTRWTFTYSGTGNQYSVSTLVDGVVKYLNIAGDAQNDSSLSLSDNARMLSVTQNDDDRYLISNGTNDLNLVGNDIGNGFAGAPHRNNGNPYTASWLKLCIYAPNLIQYQPVVIASERKNDNQNMAMQSSYVLNSNNLAQVAIELETENTADCDQWQFLLQENGKYKIQSVSGVNQQKYLKVGNSLDNNGDDHRKIDFTENMTDAAEFELNVLNGGMYAIRTVYEGKTYSIHKPNDDGFYLWKSNNDDEGNKMHLLLPKMGFLDLDGLETAIVSMNGSHALTASDDGNRAIATSGPVLADYDAGTYLDYVDGDGKHVANISLWKFEKNDDGTYLLSTKVGSTTKYLKFDKAYDANIDIDDGGGQSLVTNKNEASGLTVRAAKNGRYCLYIKANDNDLYGRYLLQWGNEIKNENRRPVKAPIEGNATGSGAADTFAFCAPVVKPLPTDVYGIACVANAYEDHPKAGNVPNLQQLGNAMLRLEPDGDNLKVAKAFVWKDDDGQIVYFNSTGNNENVSEPERPTQFYIEKATEGDDQYYIYSFIPGFGLRYLKLYDENDPKVTVSETPVTVTVTQNKTTKGQVAYNIHNGNVYLRLNRDNDGNIQNFSAVNGVPGDYPDDARFMFVKPTDKTYPQYEHTGTKVGVTQIVNPDFNTTENPTKVLIYKTIYDDTKGEYVTYGIDGDGTLVPAYDHGDQIMLYGKDDGSAWWTVQIGENGYVNFYNEVAKKYLCPQANGGVTVTDQAPGVQLRSKIDRQDKDFVAHNAAIIKWDGDSYYGLEVNNGTLRSGTVTPTEYQEFSFAKVYKETESDDWKHRVETVSDPNITVTMYDFKNDFDNGNGHSAQVITDTIGFVGYSQGATSANLMSSTLTGDWPTSNATNNSLSALFTQNGSATYPVTNTMFLKSIHDATGYYEYSAFDNFAHLNGNRFEVYEEIGAPHSEADNFFYNRGNFMPYNDLVQDSFSRNVNQFDENGVQINMSDPTLGKELYNLDGSNYYFGMTIDAPFQQPKDGRLYNGDEIVLEFNGDDDLWVYIDDVLVLDIGGDHDAISGSINFTTGEVKVNSTNFNEVYRDYLVDGRLTIQEMFQRAGKDVSTGFKENGTFEDYTTHKLRLFYMERGAAASNLHIKFNLQTVTPGALTLKKELDEDMQLDYGPEQEFYFQIFKKDGNNPLGEDDINGAENADTLLKSATIDGKPVIPETTKEINGQMYKNVFTLRPNEELILTSRNVEEEFYFKEINERDYDVYVNGQSVAKTGYVYQSTDYKADGSKVIYHNANRKAQLEIQKVFDTDQYPSTAEPEFEFQVWLKNADGKYAYYEQGDYGLKNAEGKYLWKNGESQDDYVVYDSASATGKISGIRPGQTIVIPNLLPGTEYMVMEVDEGNLYNKSYSIDDSATPAKVISEANEATGTVVGAVTGTLPTTGKDTSRVFVGKVQDTNTPNNTVYLRKTDNSDTPNPLTGAEFRLSYLNSTGAFTEIKADLKPVIAADNTDAQVEIGPLTYDTIYRIEETKAPDGYIITENGFLFRLGTDGTIQLLEETTTVEGKKQYDEAKSGVYSSITVDNGSDSSDGIVLNVKNTPGARLPATGGIGTLPFTIGGLALIIGAALMLILRRNDD